MLHFAVRRVASLAVVLFSITVLTFGIFFATPGADPAARIAGRGAGQETLAQVRGSFGLDRPLPVQYGLMMRHLFVDGDLTSYVNHGAKVLPQVRAAVPVTFSLVGGAAVIWAVLAVLAGSAAARSRGTWSDPVIMMLGVVGMSLPVYWLGEVVNLITQSRLHDSVFAWVPPLGYAPLSDGVGAWALHLLFGWLTLAVLYVGSYARVLRGELVTALGADYVRTARAKGISELRVLVRHALRCSLLAVVSLFGLDVGALIGGYALLTEVVFGLPGIGKLTYDALHSFDLPVIMATVVYAAFFVVVAGALVDLVHAWLDPRVRHG
jgi:peptide/nickel transport system permease protein